jgi:hypothetical protein
MPLYGPDGEITLSDVCHSLFQMAGGDYSLSEDRPDPEREWALRGTSPSSVIDMQEKGAGRAVSVLEWEGKARTYYSIYQGFGSVPQIWVWSCYPKNQWTEAEAQACHAHQLQRVRR